LHDALTRARAITPLRLDVLQRIAPEPRKHLSVQERGRVTLIAVPDIRYLRAELKYVTVRTATAEHLAEESLARLEQEFAERFVRIHRSCLVAREHIVGFEKEAAEGESRWAVIIDGIDEKLPVSRRQQHIVREIGRNL
jgi:two-component system response regulator AlgR